jgi:3D-(3,5/4)-trihydroxycyclohexane-1,2-dione acylhydrolase (decyclizing)
VPGDGEEGKVETLAVDLAANARSLGAHVVECQTYADFAAALQAARLQDRTTLISIQNDRLQGVPGYDSWWDVPVAETSEMPAVDEARREWEVMRARERYFF